MANTYIAERATRTVQADSIRNNHLWGLVNHSTGPGKLTSMKICPRNYERSSQWMPQLIHQMHLREDYPNRESMCEEPTPVWYTMLIKETMLQERMV
jgi:hypothetical protein